MNTVRFSGPVWHLFTQTPSQIFNKEQRLSSADYGHNHQIETQTEMLSVYLLHRLEQCLPIILKSHDQLQLGASRFHGCEKKQARCSGQTIKHNQREDNKRLCKASDSHAYLRLWRIGRPHNGTVCFTRDRKCMCLVIYH